MKKSITFITLTLLILTLVVTMVACDEKPEESETPVCNHQLVIDEAVAPTCTETGLTEGKHCSICDEILVAQETVEALGHKYDSDSDTNNVICYVCNEFASTYLSNFTFILNEDGESYTISETNEDLGGNIIIPNIYLGKLVTIIGGGAFYSNDNLTGVTIGEGVTTIGSSAFAYCSSLTSVTIPASVTTIGMEAFKGCNRMASIFIPCGVSTIGEGAFALCDKLSNIEVDDNNTSYKSIDGNLYSKTGEILIQYAIGKTDASFIIPDGVTTIGGFSFMTCRSLTSIVIPDSVITIGTNACNTCINIKDIYYTGTLEQWMKIDQGGYWAHNMGDREGFTIHFDYVPDVD